MVWRLLRQMEHDAAWNMALDEAILDAVEGRIAPATLRLYSWAETAVSVGRFQNVDRDLDLAFCSSKGIPVVRRPTGGRGILHGTDMTVTVVVPASWLGGGVVSVRAAYTRLSAAYVAAFEELGLHVEQGACERSERRTGDCFQTRSVADLVGPGGLKMTGSAMRRTQGAVLLQSSIRYRRPEVSASNVFQTEASDEHFPLEHIEEVTLRAAIVRGFEKELGIAFRPGNVTGWEEERAATLVKGVFVAENRSEAWLSERG